MTAATAAVNEGQVMVSDVSSGKIEVFSLADLRKRYDSFTARCVADCSFSTELVGGVPGNRQGVEAFVRHHLKLEGDAAEEAIARIMKEEIGERDVPSETGELQEKLSYGINVIRRDENGPYLGCHMIKACLKNSASRLAIFQQKRGSKGDLSEMGQLLAAGVSALDGASPFNVYLRNPQGTGMAVTQFDTLRGRVQSPQGSKSIVNDVETCPVGSRFSFQFRYMPTKVTKDDIVDIFASAMVIGLGSAKSFERGKFSINSLTFEAAREKRTAAPKAMKKSNGGVAEETEE